MDFNTHTHTHTTHTHTHTTHTHTSVTVIQHRSEARFHLVWVMDAAESSLNLLRDFKISNGAALISRIDFKVIISSTGRERAVLIAACGHVAEEVISDVPQRS